jgi:hypothetical protein
MTGRQARVGFSVLLLLGCGSSGSSSPTVTVPPTVAIAYLVPSAGSPWLASDGTEPALTLPCDGQIAVGLSTTNWTARAPGACGLTPLCGHSAVTASNDAGATPPELAVSSPVLLKLGAPSVWLGSANITATLQHDDGSDYLGPDGTPVTTTLRVQFSAPTNCQVGGEGGASGF